MSIRIAIFQPLVPAYRVSLFDYLASIPNFDVTVFAGSSLGSLQSITAPARYCLRMAPLWVFRVGGLEIKVQCAHLRVLFSNRYDLLILPWDAQYVMLP